MTRPFQYDNFVQSQIAVSPEYNTANLGYNPPSNHLLETSNGNQSRLSLKQKINQLLGLCKEENEGIKSQFAQVIGAQRQILDLMKEEMNQPTNFNNYARSNVQMFPSTNQLASISPIPQNTGYHSGQTKQRSHQSFPLYKSGHGGYQTHQQNYGPGTNIQNQQQRSQGTFPQGNYPGSHYSNQNISGVGNGSGIFNPQGNQIGFTGQGGYQQQRNIPAGDGNYYHPQESGQYVPGRGHYVQGPGLYNSTQGQYNPGQGQYVQGQGQYIPGQGQYIPGQSQYVPGQSQYIGGQNRTAPGQGQYLNQDPYVTDYTSINPQGGYAQGYHPSDRTNILKSKVHELKEQNGRLRNLASQGQIPYTDDDAETRQLQQQIFKLRNVIQDYQHQLSSLNNNPKFAKRSQLLRQLKDQGEKIRQDTIALLRNKSAPSGGFLPSGAGGYYGSSDLGASNRRGGVQNLNQQQHAYLRSQLNQLRTECQQLHNQSANIKRLSKGTNLTSGSRRI